ncbi:MAG: hypothetical protein K2O58_08070 [Bacteroidales bacterium]|nr:hypothetical protein [Bacteroidales bacterium]MDE7127831.1 hypothetical protein [Bacteroidales bacterium]
MKQHRSMGTLILFSVLAVLPVSCEKDYSAITNPKVEKTANVYSTYDIDWTAAADSASAAFVERFYCSSNRNGADGVFSYSEYNSRGGNGNCYWQQAHAMGAMVDYYNRIRYTDPDQAALIRTYFRRWYDKRGNNYEGNASWRGSTGFGNDFTDDTCWIIIALLQMYEATGEDTYFDAAKTTWDECVRPRFAINRYGWLPWKWTDTGANECTNGPGAIVAATLAGYAREAGNSAEYSRYLEEAYKCFDQNISVMNQDGTLSGIPLSYTQGTCMEAGRLIWKLTGEDGYLRKAVSAARGQMLSKSMNEVYNSENVMRDEGTDENNSIFHAVFFHWAARMATDKDIDSFDPRIREELSKYVLRHASYYWTRGIDKSVLGWGDSYFGVKCYEARTSGTGGSLGAYTSAAQALESMWIIDRNK